MTVQELYTKLYEIQLIYPSAMMMNVGVKGIEECIGSFDILDIKVMNESG